MALPKGRRQAGAEGAEQGDQRKRADPGHPRFGALALEPDQEAEAEGDGKAGKKLGIGQIASPLEGDIFSAEKKTPPPPREGGDQFIGGPPGAPQSRTRGAGVAGVASVRGCHHRTASQRINPPFPAAGQVEAEAPFSTLAAIALCSSGSSISRSSWKRRVLMPLRCRSLVLMRMNTR